MRFFVDVTAHGWGHLSQTVPIVEALRTRIPGFECVVRSGLPPTLVEERLGPLAGFQASDTDFGLVMASPFAVDREASLARYLALHRAFTRQVDMLAATMIHTECRAVLSNVGYLSLAAAKQAGLPSIACSSLNWSDMFRLYCGGMDGAPALQEEMQAAYACADLFLRLSPGMPMERFRTHGIDCPIARVGLRRGSDLRRKLGIESNPIVLCAFGGMMPDAPPAFIGKPEGIAVLGPSAWAPSGAIPFDAVAMPYADILASADLVISKPGYGIVAELGCLGTPSVMVSRGDWPEQKPLIEWLARHAPVSHCRSFSDLGTFDLLSLLADVPRKMRSKASPTGAELVADAIAAYIATAAA